MTIEEIKNMLKDDRYSFLRNNCHLGNRIILLGLGGSYAYGTNTSSSDIDIRGCALNSKEEILSNVSFEQFTNDETDTVIYSFNKLISLLCNCNPNCIEILGLQPDHYLYISPIGQKLLNNRHLFLSKKAIYSFGGYANQQLQRLRNASIRSASQSDQEQHILDTIEHASVNFKNRYFTYPDEAIRLYIDRAVHPEYETEIFMDINLHHYPLRDYKAMWSEMNSIVKDYTKLGKRNEAAIKHMKLGKHMMHVVRLYFMCLDILERGEIITYRKDEHDFLMRIRNEEYLDENGQPTEEFFKIVDNLESKLNEAKENTLLPDKPDYNKIKDFVISVNERVVTKSI